MKLDAPVYVWNMIPELLTPVSKPMYGQALAEDTILMALNG